MSNLARCNPGQPPAELVRIPYWGKFTPPLNILLRHAAINKDEFLLFQSVEVLADHEAISDLLDMMDDDTLVAGLAMEDAHVFVPGWNRLTGLTSPWNTFAIWNVTKLGRTGFLPISDGVHPLSPNDAGVEEVAAIALLQMLFPHTATAKLVRLPKSCYTWDVDFRCKSRQKVHHRKMQSKLLRPQVQIGAMGEIERGTVLHIDASGLHQSMINGDGSPSSSAGTPSSLDGAASPLRKPLYTHKDPTIIRGVRRQNRRVPIMNRINIASSEVTANTSL